MANNLRDLLSRIVEKHSDAIIDEAIDAFRHIVSGEGRQARGRGAGAGRTRRAATTRSYVCRVPGCGKTASPRFDMFCTEHAKSLSASEKAKIKAEQKPASGANGEAAGENSHAAGKGKAKRRKKS